MNDIFKIKLSPTFEFNKEKIEKEIKNLKLPELKLVGRLDTKSTKEELNRQIDKLKINKIKLDFSLNEKELKQKLKKIPNLKLNFQLDIKNSRSFVNEQIDKLKLNKVKLDVVLNTANVKNTMREQIGKIQSPSLNLSQYTQSGNSIYNNLKRQEKLLFDLKQKRNFASPINAEEYSILITRQEQIIKKIREEIEIRRLANKELEESLQTLEKIRNLQASQKEINRQTKIGKELTDISNATRPTFDSSTQDLELFAESYFGKFEKITSLKTKIQDVKNAQKEFTVAVKTGEGQVTEYAFSIDKATGKVFELGNKVRRVNTTIAGFGSIIQEMTSKIIKWNIATHLVSQGLDFFSKGSKFLIELDTALTEIALVTGKTRSQVEGLKNEYLSLAESTKKTVTEISKLNVSLTRQGLSSDEIQARMETILKLSAVGGIDANETLKIITSSVNALGEEAKRTADILVYADNNSASSIKSIGTAMSRVASISKTTGVSIEQLVGQISTLIDVTQEAPETLGNSLKSIMARFSKVNELGELNADINDVERAFKQVGIAFRDTDNQIRPFFELMADMATVWSDLDKNTKSMVATLSAGTMQQNRFLVLMQNWERVEKMTNALETQAGGSLDKGYSVWTESLQSDINALKIAFEELWLTMLDEGAFNVLLNGITTLIQGIQFLVENIGTSKIAFFVLARTLLPIDKITADVTGSIKGLVEELFKVDKSTNKVSRFFDVMIKGLRNGNLTLDDLNSSLNSNTKATKAKSMADKTGAISQNQLNLSAKKLNLTFNTQKLLLNGLKIALIGLKAVSTLGISLLLDSIGTFFVNIYSKGNKATKEINELNDSLKTLASNYQSNVNALKNVEKDFNKLTAIVGNNYDLTRLNNEELERYLEINNSIAEIAPEFVSFIDNENNAMIEYGTTIQDIIAYKKEMYDLDKKKTLSELSGTIAEDTKKLKDILQDIKKTNDEIDKAKNKIVLTDGERFTTGSLSYKSALETLQNKDATDTQKLKAQDVINQTQVELAQLQSDLVGKNQEFNNLLQSYKETLRLNIESVFDELGIEIPANFQGLLKKTTNSFFENLVRESPKDLKGALQKTTELAYSLINIRTEMMQKLKDDTPLDLSDNIKDLQDFEQVLIDLGLSSQVAGNVISDIAFSILNLGNTASNVTAQISSLSDVITSNLSKVNSLQTLAEKALSNNLTFGDIDTFRKENLDAYDEFLRKVSQGTEINIALNEVLISQINKINDETNTYIGTLAKENEQIKKNLLDEERNLVNNLKTLEIKGQTNTSIYRSLQKQLENTKAKLQNIDKEIFDNIEKLNASKKLYEQMFNDEQLKSVNNEYKKYTDNIEKYQSMLSSIKEKGISGDLIKDILLNYPELINYIDNEVALTNELNNLLVKEQQLQKETYRIKLSYTQSFYKALLANNKSVIDALSRDYKIDLKNFANVAQAKEQILTQISNKYRRVNSLLDTSMPTEYAQMSTQGIQNEIKNIESQLASKQSLLQKSPYAVGVRQEIDTLKNKLQALKEYASATSVFDINLDKAVGAINWDKLTNVPSTSSSSKNISTRKSIIELIKLEKEEYLKLNKELEKNNRLTERNSQLMGYAMGADKIALMQKENELLTQRQKLNHQLANQYREEQAVLKKELAKTIKINSQDSGMSSFTQLMTQKENEINSIIKKINATTNESTIDSLTSKKEKLEKEVNKIAEQYKRYIEITFNTIPDLQDDYYNLIFKKFDNMVEAMRVQIDKYNNEVSRLNILKGLVIGGRSDNTKELERELAIHKEISQIYLNEIKFAENKLKSEQNSVKNLELQLSKVQNKSSNTTENLKQSLILAKKMNDEALQIYENSIQSYADSLNSKVNIEIQLLNKLREETKNSLQDLRKEIDSFTLDEFNNSIEEILNSLDKIDGIFVGNADFKLNTTDSRNNIKEIEESINKIRSNTERWKSTLDQVKNSNKSTKEIIEDVKNITTELITAENQLNEEIAKKNQEIQDLKLEYNKIENSLQNQIDLKKEELDELQEEIQHEQKINSLIEKRLQLLQALDDTSQMYVTGQGTVEWTYDKYAVNDLLKQINQENKQSERDKIAKEIQEEINQMIENLKKTKEIHQQNLAINELQLKQLEKEREYIGKIIESSMESLDKTFDKMIDNYIDNINEELKKNNSTLLDIYNLLRQNVGSKNFNYNNLQREITVGKNEETLQKIANKYNVSLEKLLELNKHLNRNSLLNFGQKIKLPSFDKGGYTGKFGKDGRLAILHEQELVLNKRDTRNLLDIVNIARNMMNPLNYWKPNNQSADKNNIINIQNINLPQVNNVNQFINELQNITRRGLGSLN